MAWGKHIVQRGRKGAETGAYYASHPNASSTVATLLPQRRGLWFAISLLGSGATLCLAALTYLSVGKDREVATIPVNIDLREMAPAPMIVEKEVVALQVPAFGPLITGSIDRTREPVMRQTLTEPDKTILKALPGINTATLGLAAAHNPGSSQPGGPAVKGDAPVRLASLGTSS